MSFWCRLNGRERPMARACDVLFDNDVLHLCGHRGHSIDGAENSKSSLRTARNKGATLCEIDIRLTADDEFIVFHDPILDTASDGTGPVRSLTLKELRSIRHKPRNTNGSAEIGQPGDHLACFEEILEFAATINIGLVVEVKDRLQEKEHIKKILELVEASSLRERVLISSFDHSFLRDLKQDYPETSTFGIMHTRHVSPVRIAEESMIDVYSVDYPRFHPDDAAALCQNGIRVATFFPRSVVTQNDWDIHFGGLNDTLESARAGHLAIVGLDDVAWGKSFLEDNGIAFRYVPQTDMMA